MHRLFVALPLPTTVRDQLAGLRGGLVGARWTAPANLHLTLRFIGEVEGPSVADAIDALDMIDVVPLTLSLKGLGLFGPARRPGMLWAGVEGGAPLADLQRRVDAAIDGAGLPRERRRFTPHVTVARLKQSPDDRLDRYLAAHAGFTSPDFTVDTMHLYESRLGHDGPVYTSLGAFGSLPATTFGETLAFGETFDEDGLSEEAEQPVLAAVDGEVLPTFDERGRGRTSWGGPPSPWRDADIWPNAGRRTRRR
ncbi:RNA 2',3'-cyclic phosphodiesterase [Tistrella mobilis]|uniref:RNA 2',3'-cyclic phosphodiesterase n=1 Tax=Tistrella mobilis TaxID=171437 RepID=UPI003558C614